MDLTDLAMDCPKCGTTVQTEFGVLGNLGYAEWLCTGCDYWWVRGEAVFEGA